MSRLINGRRVEEKKKSGNMTDHWDRRKKKCNRDLFMNEQNLIWLRMFVNHLVLYYSSTQSMNSINHRTTFALVAVYLFFS